MCLTVLPLTLARRSGVSRGAEALTTCLEFVFLAHDRTTVWWDWGEELVGSWLLRRMCFSAMKRKCIQSNQRKEEQKWKIGLNVDVEVRSRLSPFFVISSFDLTCV